MISGDLRSCDACVRPRPQVENTSDAGVAAKSAVLNFAICLFILHSSF
jgi:hypothetical protein